jgi:hypothetical protein
MDVPGLKANLRELLQSRPETERQRPESMNENIYGFDPDNIEASAG